MWLVATSVLLAAAPGGARALVAVPSVSYVNLTDKEGDAFIDAFAQQLAQASGAEIATRTTIAQLLGAERQRQLLGCSDDSSSCLMELSGALGAEHVVTGSLGRLGAVFTVTLKLVHSQTAKSISSFTARAESEAQLLDVLQAGAGQMARALRGEPAVASVAAPPSVRWGARFWAPAAVTVGLGIAGAVFVGMDRAAVASLQQDSFSGRAAIDAVVARGELSRALGIGCLVGAGVSLALTLVLLALPEPARLALAAVGLGGSL